MIRPEPRRPHFPTLAICLIGAGLAFGQEHPKEHPKGKAPSAMTKDDLADAIGEYVKRDAGLKGGYYLVYDASAKKPLALTLEKVHREKLARVGEDTYFACADFKSSEGTIYDLDIFMKGAAKDKLTVTEVAVHKEAGKERYGWVEKDGTWTKSPVAPQKG